MQPSFQCCIPCLLSCCSLLFAANQDAYFPVTAELRSQIGQHGYHIPAHVLQAHHLPSGARADLLKLLLELKEEVDEV